MKRLKAVRFGIGGLARDNLTQQMHYAYAVTYRLYCSRARPLSGNPRQGVPELQTRLNSASDNLSGPHSIEDNAANVNSTTNPIGKSSSRDAQPNQFSTSVPPFISRRAQPILPQLYGSF